MEKRSKKQKVYPRLEVRFRNQTEYEFANGLLEEAREILGEKHKHLGTLPSKKETLITLLEEGLDTIKEKDIEDDK